MDDVPDLAALRRERVASDAEYIEQLEQFSLGQERELRRLRTGLEMVEAVTDIDIAHRYARAALDASAVMGGRDDSTESPAGSGSDVAAAVSPAGGQDVGTGNPDVLPSTEAAIHGWGVWHGEDREWIGFGATNGLAAELIPDRPGYEHLSLRPVVARIAEGGQVMGGHESEARPFVLLPGLTAAEAGLVRDCIRLVIDNDLTGGQNLWPLHTAFAEAVTGHEDDGGGSELSADASEPSHLVPNTEVGGEEPVGVPSSGLARPVQGARGSTHAVGSDGIECEVPEGQHVAEDIDEHDS